MVESYTQLRLDVDVYKQCSRCFEVLLRSAFSRRKRARDGLQAYCKACMRENYNRWRTANLERWNAYHREWNQRNPEQRLRIRQRHYQRNRLQEVARVSQWRQENREWVRNYENLYRRITGKGRLYNAAYAARKRKVLNIVFTAEQLAEKVAYWGNRCWLCQGMVEAIDHVIPLSKGGPHCLANLRPACKSCNSRKHNIWPYDRI